MHSHTQPVPWTQIPSSLGGHQTWPPGTPLRSTLLHFQDPSHLIDFTCTLFKSFYFTSCLRSVVVFTLIAKTLYCLYFAGFDQVLFLAPAYSLMYMFCPWPDLVSALIVIHISDMFVCGLYSKYLHLYPASACLCDMQMQNYKNGINAHTGPIKQSALWLLHLRQITKKIKILFNFEKRNANL